MEIRNIAIVKLSSLGDIIHTIPAFNLLRKNFPNIKITWFAEPHGEKLLKCFKGIDEIVIIDIKNRPFLKKISYIKKIYEKYGNKFDISIDFQGLIKSSILSYIIGKERLGFNKKNLREPVSSVFYTKKAEEYNEGEHVIKKNINLLRPLKIYEEKISFPLANFDKSDMLKNFLKKNKLKKNNFIILNIGAGWQSKLLTSSQYIEMINDLKDQFKIIILWGNKEEKVRADHIAKMTGAVKSPFLNFPDLILFIKLSKVLISSDSLPLHISDMVGTPAVGIFGPTSPKRNGPLNTDKLIIQSILKCSYCYKRYCKHKKCLQNPNTEKIKEFILSRGS